VPHTDTTSHASTFCAPPPIVSVLVIDDDDEARDMMDAVLGSAGYTVVTAANGSEALELLHRVRPELILLDVCMPICNGAEFRQQQRRNREWIRIPTIVMTGVEDEPVLDVAVEEALRKPIRASELLAIAARHCTRH
jgi:CheY-like chemotaxis protein